MRAKTVITISALICLSITSRGFAENRHANSDRDNHEKKERGDKERAIIIHLRETQSPIETVQPGETFNVASACEAGEAIVGGGPTSIPAPVKIVFSTLFFDGTRSGWQVEYRNDGDQPVDVSVATSALCIRGRLVQTITQLAQ